jgi:hypothetical protein
LVPPSTDSGMMQRNSTPVVGAESSAKLVGAMVGSSDPGAKANFPPVRQWPLSR